MLRIFKNFLFVVYKSGVALQHGLVEVVLAGKSKKVLISLYAVILCVIFYAYKKYGENLIFEYFICGTAVFSVVFLLFCVSDRINRRLFIFGGVFMLFIMYGAEAAYRLSEDTRLKIEVVNSLRKNKGAHSYGMVFPGDALEALTAADAGVRHPLKSEEIILPLGGISYSWAAVCREYGRDNHGWIVERLDRHGFNNPDEVWEDAAGPVLVVGDSMGFSECVPRGHGIVSALRPRRRVVNLSMSGNGPILELSALLEYGRRTKPEIVVWLFYENDMDNLMERWNNALLQDYLDGGVKLLPEKQPVVDKLLIEIHESAMNAEKNRLRANPDEAMREYPFSGIESFLKLRYLRSKFGIVISRPYEPTDFSPVWYERYGSILRTAKGAIETWGGELVFVVLPSYNEMAASSEWSAGVRRAIKKTAAPYADFLIDMADVFSDVDDIESLWQCPECHYTSRGFALLSEALADAVEQQYGDKRTK